MNKAILDLLPYVASVLSFFTAFFILKVTWQIAIEFRYKVRRSAIIERYQSSTKAASKRAGMQLAMARKVVGVYGDKIVKDRYRVKLEKLLVTSGDWENRNYSSLIQKKFYFAATGFFISFMLLILNTPNLLPVFILVVLVSYTLPDIERLLQKATGNRYRKKLKTLLDQSGSWQENDYFKLIRRKIIFGVGGFVLSYLYLIAKERSYSSLIFGFIAIFIGFFLPDILLQNKVLKRKEALANSLPDAIDMLQMCVNAGLAFPAALTKVAETQSGPVAEEFARVTTEVQLGQARSTALAAMADRTQEPNVLKFVGAMMQVDRFGIPIGNVLIEQSKEMRASRRERAKERGQKVPVKILAPIMLCFLPSVLLIILGPAVISILGAFSG